MRNLFKTLYQGLTHNADGMFSSTKTLQVLGFAFVTWWLIELVLAGTFTDWYLLSYLIFPFGLRGLQTFANVRFGKPADKDETN